MAPRRRVHSPDKQRGRQGARCSPRLQSIRPVQQERRARQARGSQALLPSAYRDVLPARDPVVKGLEALSVLCIRNLQAGNIAMYGRIMGFCLPNPVE